MSIAVAIDKSVMCCKDTILREHTRSTLGYDKIPNLIRCNNGHSCGCSIVKKRFVKMQSSDSGGSFDCPDNAECAGTTVAVNENNDIVLATAYTKELNDSIYNANGKVTVTTLSELDSSQYLESYPSMNDSGKTSVSLTNEESGNVCKKNEKFSPQTTSGVCVPASANLGNSASDSVNISYIFSKLAKNIVSRKSEQNSRKSDNLTSMTEHDGEMFCEVDGKPLTDTNHLMTTFGDRNGIIKTVDKSRSSVPRNCDLITAEEDVQLVKCGLGIDQFPSMPAQQCNVKCVRRRMSDSGSSTGSNSLSDDEKISLNGSKGSADVSKSILSLDLGISVASFDSLGEKSFTDLDDVSEGCQRGQTNIDLAVSDDDLNQHTLDLCVNNFKTRNQHAVDTLSAADKEAFSVEAEACADELDILSSRLSSSKSSPSIEFGDFHSFAEEVLDGSSHSGTSESETCSYSSNSPASSSTTQTHSAVCVKKKRDFHLWGHNLVNMCQSDSDLSDLEYFNISPERGDNLTVKQISADSAVNFASAKNVANVQQVMPKLCLGHDDYNYEEICSKQTTGSFDSESLQQMKKVTKISSNRPRNRRVGICSINGLKDVHQRERQSLSNDTLTSSNTSATLSCAHKIDTSNCINPDLTATNPRRDVSARTTSSSFNNTAVVNSSLNDTILNDTSLNDTNKHKGLVHTNCLKTVGTAFRRLSSPTKNFQLPNIFGSSRCKYDLELASIAYSLSYSSTPVKSDRQIRLMKSFSSSKSLSFPTATLYKVTPHLRDAPSSSLAPSSSYTPLSKRFRSFSVDACSTACKRSDASSLISLPLDSETPPNNLLETAFYEKDECSLLLDALFDAKKAERNKLPYPYNGSDGRAPKKAQQFGLSLNDIKNNTGRIIPLPVEETVEFLKTVGGDEVEGLFRRCARVSTMKEVQEKYDDGEKIDFESYSDPHLAAAILKKFLRELQEPLMTYDLFEPITRLHFLETNKQLTEVQRILQDELPEDNYIILKYVFQFLRQVVSKSDINHMTAVNIATVFGPNIAWPKGQANLATVEQAVKFALILVQNFDDVFLR